jgi:hypothetical protein
MIEVYALAVIVVAVTGAMAGILAILAVGIRREDKAYSLRTVARPGRLASGVRAVTGAHARGPRVVRPATIPGRTWS